VLAYGQPPQETPNNLPDQPIHGELYVLSGILIESVLFSYLVNSMQSQARSTSWVSAIDRSIAIDLLAIPAVGKQLRSPNTGNELRFANTLFATFFGLQKVENKVLKKKKLKYFQSIGNLCPRNKKQESLSTANLCRKSCTSRVTVMAT